MRASDSAPRFLSLIFRVHQPYRLAVCSSISPPERGLYFDVTANRRIAQNLTESCFRPMNRRLLAIAERFPTAFRCAFSLSGTALAQLGDESPAALESFGELLQRGGIEVLGETSHHSLASSFDSSEFRAQVELHRERIHSFCGLSPQVFRDTDFSYVDSIAPVVASLGFKGMLIEGAPRTLAGRSPHHLYRSSSAPLPLLIRDPGGSKEVKGFFTAEGAGCSHGSILLEKLRSSVPRGGVAVVCLDYEMCSAGCSSETGAPLLLEEFLQAALTESDWQMVTPSEVIDSLTPIDFLPVNEPTSTAKTFGYPTRWVGNTMQERVLRELYALGPMLRRCGDPDAFETWRRLLTSDHVDYISTRPRRELHSASPYESPYDAFINLMNILAAFRSTAVERPLHFSRGDNLYLASEDSPR